MSSIATSTANPNPIPTLPSSPKAQTAKEVIASNIKLLIEQLEAGHSEGLTAYLCAMGRFHNYSFGNILEIARQKPNATRVAGLYTWNQLGRKVMKGQKGIRILAPVIGIRRKKDSEAEKDLTKQNLPVLVGFRSAYVFDVSQTDGAPLPELSERVKGSVDEYRERLIAFAFYNRRFLPLSAITALVLLGIPPLGLVTVTHPLIAAGHWFPGTRWFGLALPLLLIASYRHFRFSLTFAILLATFLTAHARFHRPPLDPSILPLNTHFGGIGEGWFGLDSETREIALQRMALAHPNTLVLLPESILPSWSLVREMRWADTFAHLKQQHTGLLIGTTIPIPNTEANRNVLLSRGYTEHLSYVQRVPVPLGMWRGSEHDGFPLMLRFPPMIRVWNHRAGVLICYEQLLVWPALETLARNPDMLLAPSNLYWASGTPIPAIQHVSAEDWADLWAIPLYEARNQ